MEVPEAWQAAKTNGKIQQNAEFSSETDPWWQQLQDPDLNALVEQALDANPDLMTARSRVREARALVGIAESGLLPQLSAGANYAEIELSERTPILEKFIKQGQAETRQQLFDVGFDAKWELDLFGGTRRAVEAGMARAAAAEAGLANARLSLQSEVIRNYIQLRLAQRQLDILKQQTQLQEQIVALAQEQISAGVGTEFDLRSAQALLHSIRAQVPDYQIQELTAVYRMSVLTDQDVARLSEYLTDSKALPNPPDMVPLGLPGTILRRRPDIHQAEMQLRAATAEIGVRTAQLFPQFSLTGMAGAQASRFSNLFESGSGTWAILPGVRWALFQGDRIRTQIESAELRQEQAFQSYRQTVNEAVAEVETALTRYGLSFQTRTSLESMLTAQRSAVELSKEAYQSGVADFLDILEAQKQLTQNLITQAEARAATLLALVSLEKALGGDWDTQLDDAPDEQSLLSSFQQD